MLPNLSDARTEPAAPQSPRIEAALSTARLAQATWSAVPVRRRLAVLRRFRHLLAERAEELARCVPRPAAETLSSQILPLADHVLFLERQAPRALRTKRLGRAGRPVWLLGTFTEIQRVPAGVVLILAPSNYPIFIPGTQLIQALAAGNAVVLKPSPQGRRAALALIRLLNEAGLDPDLACVLPSDNVTADAAVRAGPDRILLTGSSDTGRAVLAAAAEQLIPCTPELSGSDPVFIRADADLDRAARALCFGLSLNDGATCIAPRRVFVDRTVAARFERILASHLKAMAPIPIPVARAERLRPLVTQALQLGAVALGSTPIDWTRPTGPIVLASATPSMALLQADLFAPVAALVHAMDDADALDAAAESPFALGASVFSADESAARKFAERIRAGVVTINDLILPTADPRIPFGGRGASGYGVTRGIEGLLELTHAKVVAVRRGKWLPHLGPAAPEDADFFASALRAAHAQSGWRRFLSALETARLGWRRSPTRPTDAFNETIVRESLMAPAIRVVPSGSQAPPGSAD
ncbi:MAG: aldehyde dehydrogenase family protein [Limisphaerales bacterium]